MGTYWLGSVVDVEVVRKLLVGVAHVLAGVDVEVLLLLVSDLEDVLLNVGRVFSEEGADHGVVVLG